MNYAFENPPSKFDKEEMNRLLTWATNIGASDIFFVSDEPVYISINGRLSAVTKRALVTPEVGDMINFIYGTNGTSIIAGGNDVDTGYTIKSGRYDRFRFRFNGTQINVDGHPGYSITMRTIPSVPPSISDINLPNHLVDAMLRPFGMSIVTGETGSGKTTLQAALIRHVLESEEFSSNILTYEYPIEFMYTDIEKKNSLIQQTEIPVGLKSFERGVFNSLRRKPNIVVIGESRDKETMSASFQVAKSGHLLMTTLHSNGVASTIRRAVGLFPEGERNSAAIDFIEFTNIILTQRLLKTVDGKRAPVREYLIFDEQIRDQLLRCHVDKLPALARDLTKKHGQTLSDDAKRLFEEGRISEREYKMIAVVEKSQDEDSKASVAYHGTLSENFLDNVGKLS